MSGFGGPGGRQISYKPSPPERGSFPLDHDAECKHFMTAYLRCIKSQNPPGQNNEECRLHAKNYLGCRMDKGLMAKDEWKNLGYETPTAAEAELQNLKGSGGVGSTPT